jgi:hypothetical protein
MLRDESAITPAVPPWLAARQPTSLSPVTPDGAERTTGDYEVIGCGDDMSCPYHRDNPVKSRSPVSSGVNSAAAACRGFQSVAYGSLEALVSRTVSVIAFRGFIIMVQQLFVKVDSGVRLTPLET